MVGAQLGSLYSKARVTGRLLARTSRVNRTKPNNSRKRMLKDETSLTANGETQC